MSKKVTLSSQAVQFTLKFCHSERPHWGKDKHKKIIEEKVLEIINDTWNDYWKAVDNAEPKSLLRISHLGVLGRTFQTWWW